MEDALPDVPVGIEHRCGNGLIFILKILSFLMSAINSSNSKYLNLFYFSYFSIIPFLLCSIELGLLNFSLVTSNVPALDDSLKGWHPSILDFHIIFVMFTFQELHI